MLRRHVSEWIDSRRRVREEFDFHFEQLADQYLRAGFPVSEARKAARRRMGSMFRHKRQALYELQARWRDLFSAEMLDGVGPWSRVSLIIAGGFRLGLIFSTRVTILTAGVFWLPVLAAGLAWLAVSAAERMVGRHLRFLPAMGSILSSSQDLRREKKFIGLKQDGLQSSATSAVSAYSSLEWSRVAVSVDSSTELLWSMAWGGLRQF